MGISWVRGTGDLSKYVYKGQDRATAELIDESFNQRHDKISLFQKAQYECTWEAICRLYGFESFREVL